MWRFVHVHCAHRWKTVGQVEHPSPQTPILSLWGRYSNSLLLAFFFQVSVKICSQLINRCTQYLVSPVSHPPTAPTHPPPLHKSLSHSCLFVLFYDTLIFTRAIHCEYGVIHWLLVVSVVGTELGNIILHQPEPINSQQLRSKRCSSTSPSPFHDRLETGSVLCGHGTSDLSCEFMTAMVARSLGNRISQPFFLSLGSQDTF